MIDEQKKEIETLYTRLDNQMNIDMEHKIKVNKQISELEGLDDKVDELHEETYINAENLKTDMKTLKDNMQRLFTNQNNLSAQMTRLRKDISSLEEKYEQAPLVEISVGEEDKGTKEEDYKVDKTDEQEAGSKEESYGGSDKKQQEGQAEDKQEDDDTKLEDPEEDDQTDDSDSDEQEDKGSLGEEPAEAQKPEVSEQGAAVKDAEGEVSEDQDVDAGDAQEQDDSDDDTDKQEDEGDQDKKEEQVEPKGETPSQEKDENAIDVAEALRESEEAQKILKVTVQPLETKIVSSGQELTGSSLPKDLKGDEGQAQVVINLEETSLPNNPVDEAQVVLKGENEQTEQVIIEEQDESPAAPNITGIEARVTETPELVGEQISEEESQKISKSELMDAGAKPEGTTLEVSPVKEEMQAEEAKEAPSATESIKEIGKSLKESGGRIMSSIGSLFGLADSPAVVDEDSDFND